MSSSPSTPRSLVRSPYSIWFHLLFWTTILLGLAIPAGMAVWAWRQLLHPLTQDLCQNVWQAETASIRISCAEARADSRDADSLLDAIRIADGVGINDPMRGRSDRLIQTWSAQVLELAEAAYQDGNLKQAEDWLTQLPERDPIAQQGRDRLSQWQRNWKQAEELYKQAEEKLDQNEWSEVMALGRQILALGNRYWATTRYQELMDNLADARENKPWTRQTTRKPEDKNKPDDLMTRWKQVSAAEDQKRLKQARALAVPGKLDDIRAAISEASLILSDSPSYAEAQTQIKTWERQVAVGEDQIYLDRARELAQIGDTLSLRSAINEIDWIPGDRPLYPEARKLIQQWNDQLVQLRTQPPSVSQPSPAQPVSTEPPTPTTPTQP